MKSHSTIKVLIFSLLLLAVSAGIAIYTFTAIDQHGKKLIIDLKSLKDHYYLKSEYAKLKTEVDESAADRERLSSLVLEGEDGAVNFLSLVDTLAKDLNLNLTTKQLTEEVTKETGFDDLFVEFGITGDARSAIKLIQLFELLPYHSQVIHLNVARKVDPLTNLEIVDASIGVRISIKEG